MRSFFLLLIILTAISCNPKKQQIINNRTESVKVELVTSKGVIVIELSNKTPLHRDNFIKIVNEGRLDSLLFHRVLNDFVVQAGMYDSLKLSKMDSLDFAEIGYKIPAELDTSLFHKRGAISAARTPNVERASSSISFAIVQRGPRNDSLLDIDEERINGWLQQHYFLHAKENKIWLDSLHKTERESDWKTYKPLYDTVTSIAESFDFTPYVIPEHHREIYRTLGGNAHLDQNYTVFGEVLSGMSVVDSIAAVQVKNSGRPLKNVYIISAKVLEE